ncbi:uncharacterized protein LOC128558345 [Mercenaria mercenaria]|uniref:uncharacterized protein LOC128558345 n=1 Tax=Mercenaria mercenaria TaxID=6596 RepID=UPI00234F584A|nr:uncharacterized protein LOC128558345 [Mercenaria mercenaria]
MNIGLFNRDGPKPTDKESEIVASTNNGIESHHRMLKKSYMHGKTTFNLTSMLKILVNEFFPARYRAFVDKNQEFSGKFKKYSDLVPVPLQRRPRQSIRHCLQNVELSKDINPDDVKSIEGDFFTVVSGKKTYGVSLGDDIHVPFCDCMDWYKFHMPCKHIIATISSETDINWQRLSTVYMQSVYCIVDDFEDVTDRNADNECETSGDEVEINGTKEANTEFEEVTESKPDMADECEKEVKETNVTEEAVQGHRELWYNMDTSGF